MVGLSQRGIRCLAVAMCKAVREDDVRAPAPPPGGEEVGGAAPIPALPPPSLDLLPTMAAAAVAAAAAAPLLAMGPWVLQGLLTFLDPPR